jgi:hypothetical protein
MVGDPLTRDTIAVLAANSDVPMRDRLAAANRGRSDAVGVAARFVASSAVEAYRVRLGLWRDDVLPTMTGFQEFVGALSAAGDEPVAMATIEDPHRRFVLLLSADLGALLGAVEIARGDRDLDTGGLPL